ncbi:MAG TPA: hypothetical protein VF406_18040 [Thermodesulfobacteriota bacterium]
MRATLRDRGQYELVENHGRLLLVLDGTQWFSWLPASEAEAPAIEIDEPEGAARTVRQGEFYLMDIVDDPTLRDGLHLFLEGDGAFDEVLLPDGIPTEHEGKTVIATGYAATREELEAYLAPRDRVVRPA